MAWRCARSQRRAVVQAASSSGESEGKPAAWRHAGQPQRSAGASRIPRARPVKPEQQTAHSGELDREGDAQPCRVNCAKRAVTPRSRGPLPGDRTKSVGRQSAEAAEAAAAERRSRANLVRALNLLRCIKAVIEGLPEEEVGGVLSPGERCMDSCMDTVAAAGTTPITQVWPRYVVCYVVCACACVSACMCD